MHSIKGVLVVLSLLQFITLPSFWQSEFYVFFLWIIAFQLLWFYIETRKLRKMMLGLLAVFAMVNSILLPEFPLLMYALYAIDIREEFSRVQAGVIFGSLFLLQSGIWAFFIGWPERSILITTLAIIIIAFWSTEQAQVIKRRNEQHYAFLLAQNEWKDKNDLLKMQMQSMEEVYTLNERNRISRDLHDSIGHTLSTLVIQLAAIEKLTEKKAPRASKMLKDLHEFTKKGLDNVREVIHEMKPEKYDRIAFIEKINQLIKEFETNTHVQVYFNQNELLWPLNEEQEQMVFRAIQEFLANTLKHSEATEVRIQNHFTESTLILTMQDNGKGTDEITPQMGLTGMKERTKLLGGKVSIQSAANNGFKVRIVLPKGGHVNVPTLKESSARR
ncbi:MAG TPA: sensor histidine kinase [Atopostipes sp.]|nr:sensor histidine kinase [Atopostipes sp.]